MIVETLHLGAATLSGAWMALAVAEKLSVHFTKAPLTSYADYVRLWPIIFVAPIFIYNRSRHYWLRRQRIYGTEPAAVYPHRDPLGVDFMLNMARAIKEHQLLEVWDDMFARLGPTFWHQATGSWAVLTMDPDNLKDVLSTKFHDWVIGGVRQKSLLLTIGPHSIFAVNGKEWQTARALIRPSFTRNQVADLECQDRHVERFLAKIPKDGSTVDLQSLLHLLTMDSATDFMFGYSTDTLINPTEETQEFTKCFDYMLLLSVSRGRMGWISYLKPDKEFDRSVATCRRFIDRYLAKAIADSKIKERPYIFLTELLESGASQDEIRQQLLSMTIGGRDTTAGTLSYLFWVMARRPDVYQKAREEVAVLGGEKPTWEDLKGFKYINMVIKETLRLYPAVGTNVRCAARDTVLPKGGGKDSQSPVFVPKGTQCRFSMYSLHRRKEFFGEDADEFRPERWQTLRTTWEYLAFLGGPRTCIGQQFALTQMAYVFTRLLQTFEAVVPRDDRPMLHRAGVSNSLANGCYISFKPA